MKLATLFVAAWMSMALCPMTTWCRYHGTQATRKSTEVRNGRQFAFFEHYYIDRGERKLHSFTEECGE